MDIKPSFSKFIKNEILEYNWPIDQLEILFNSFLVINGNFKNDIFTLKTSLLNWEEKILSLFKEFYDIVPKVENNNNLLNFKIKNPDFISKFNKISEKIIINNIEKNKAYIAGAFVGKGWINLPSSRFYHCEIRTKDENNSLLLQDSLNKIGIKSTTIIKKSWYYTYIKKSLEISNLIRAVKAFESLMIFEDKRIERDFLATYKKMESIETYNFKKSEEFSQKQIESIKKILNTQAFNSLDIKKINLAKLRIEKPNYSLSELQIEYNNRNNKNYSKSTINNWLNLIVNLEKNK